MKVLPSFVLLLFLHLNSNIQPMRTVLRRRKEEFDTEGVLAFFPYLPMKRLSSSKVAVDVSESKSRAYLEHKSGRSTFGGGLERILNFPPLLNAFEDYCLKALCIEV